MKGNEYSIEIDLKALKDTLQESRSGGPVFVSHARLTRVLEYITNLERSIVAKKA